MVTFSLASYVYVFIYLFKIYVNLSWSLIYKCVFFQYTTDVHTKVDRKHKM